MSQQSSNFPSQTTLILIIIFTALSLASAYLYLSGTFRDVTERLAERFSKAEAKAEENALEKMGRQVEKSRW